MSTPRPASATRSQRPSSAIFLGSPSSLPDLPDLPSSPASSGLPSPPETNANGSGDEMSLSLRRIPRKDCIRTYKQKHRIDGAKCTIAKTHNRNWSLTCQSSTKDTEIRQLTDGFLQFPVNEILRKAITTQDCTVKGDIASWRDLEHHYDHTKLQLTCS